MGLIDKKWQKYLFNRQKKTIFARNLKLIDRNGLTKRVAFSFK